MRAGAALIVLGLLTFSIAGGDGNSAAKIAQAQKELEPRPLTLPPQSITAAQFLSQLEMQTGNAVADRRTRKHDQPLALEFDKVPFWQALDQFAARANCGYTAYGNDGGVALIDATRRSHYVSYHGITRTALKRRAVAQDSDADTATCTIHLDVAWEPRFQPFYVGVGPVSAAYVPRGVAKELKVQAPGRGQLPVAGRSAVEVELHLPAPPRQSPAIASLEGSFKFIGPSKMLTFRFADIKANAVLEQEKVSVRLTKVKEGLDRVLIDVQIDNPEGTPVFESYQTWLDNNRISLVKGDGAKQSTWSPEPNETILVETNRRAVLQYAFLVTKGKGKLTDWTLVYRTPGRIVELAVPYRFKDVPLP
jgi:hypothetical protein